MTERILKLQVHEDLGKIERWYREGLLPVRVDMATITRSHHPGCRLLTLHTDGLNNVHAIFIDRPDEPNSQARIIYGIHSVALGQEKVNVHTFVEYAQRCKYVDAKLYLNTDFKYMRGKVHHRLITPEMMPLGTVPETIELHHKSNWEHKLELLKHNSRRNTMRLKLVDFSQEETKKVCKALRFELVATVFVL